MKSFVRYISKYFVSFSVLIIGLVLFNLLAFIWTFHRIVLNDFMISLPCIQFISQPLNCDQ